MVKILITGSSGMLGQALCNKLGEEHNVVGIDIKKRKENRGQKADFFKIDITNKGPIIEKVKEIEPDLIIHCAAYTDVDGCELDPKKAYESNVTATRNITKACSLTSSYIIYISTDFVFDGKKKNPYAEEDKPNPINIYGKTKLEGENIVKQMSGKYLIVRTSWLFGNGGENFVDIIIKKARKEKEIKVVNDQIGCPTYTVDLADAITSIIDKQQTTNNKQQILHITNSGFCSWYEFAKEIIKSAGIKGVEVKPITSGLLNRPAKRPMMSILDNSKFVKIYGKSLPVWKDGLERYLSAYAREETS